MTATRSDHNPPPRSVVRHSHLENAYQKYTNLKRGGDSDGDDGVGGDASKGTEDAKHWFEFCACGMDVFLYDNILVFKKVDSRRR